MRGSIVLPMGLGNYHCVAGGRYFDRPAEYAGVKMAVEIRQPFTVSVPVRDFSIPTVEVAETGLEQTIDLILSGEKVYVGCAGGIGRTGLMLALLAKAWGIPDPIVYVRKNYYPHAVETADQIKFIESFVVPKYLKNKIFRHKLKAFLKFKFKSCLTNR